MFTAKKSHVIMISGSTGIALQQPGYPYIWTRGFASPGYPGFALELFLARNSSYASYKFIVLIDPVASQSLYNTFKDSLPI